MTNIINDDISNINKRYTSQRAGFIETNTSVLGKNIEYTATRQIVLKNGFEASGSNNTMFKASIESSNDDYKAQKFKVIGTQSGNVISYAASKNKIIHKDFTNNNIAANTNIKVYPNPARDMVKIQVPKSNLPISFYITDSKGIVVYKDIISEINYSADLSSLSSGVYIIKCFDSHQSTNIKLIIK